MAALDHTRGPIERCFNAMPPHRRRKTGLGTAEPTVMPPMGVARITDLRLACRRFRSGVGLSCHQRLRLLPMNRCDRRSLVDVGPPPPDHGPGGHQRYAASP